MSALDQVIGYWLLVHGKKHNTLAMNHELQAKRTTNRKGFTLIELMVTITIIAILASVGLVVYSTVQKTGRISKRVQDLQALQTAIELFKSTNGYYPKVASGCVSSFTGSNSLVPTFMPAVPNDPSGGTYCYKYAGSLTPPATGSPDGIDYKVYTDPDLASGSSPEMIATNFNQQPAMIDPFRDGNPNCTIDTTGCVDGSGNPISCSPQAWAYYTQGACGL